MAPASSPHPFFFDYRGQIEANCEFFSGKNDYIFIITDRDPSGTYKAVAVRYDNDTREALLASEPCESVQSAIQSLHNKSSEAVHLFIKANGYNQPKYPKIEEHDIDDDEDTASVVSEQSTGSSAAGSTWESSGEEATPASPPSKENRSSPKSEGKARKSRFPAEISLDRKSKGDDSDDEAPLKATSPNGQPRHTSLTAGWSVRPPPHPLYRGHAPRMPSHPVSPLVAHRQSLPPSAPGHPIAGFHLAPSQPGVRPVGVPGTVARVFDVRITIRWLHHSEQRIFESSRASIRALQDTVLTYVRTHMNAFENVTPLDRSPNKLWSMRATIKHSFFGSEAYDMSGYRGDDLTKLFTIVGKNDIPRFEVEVDYARPPPPPASIMPMNNGAMSA